MRKSQQQIAGQLMLWHEPLGPGRSFKTGQRVPLTGLWQDIEDGTMSYHERHGTFPPLTGRNGKSRAAYRRFVKAMTVASI